MTTNFTYGGSRQRVKKVLRNTIYVVWYPFRKKKIKIFKGWNK